MKRRFLSIFLILFSLFTNKCFSSDYPQFFGPFPSRKLCPKTLTVEDFKTIEEQTLTTGRYIELPDFPFIRICFDGDISAIHYKPDRFPVHSFQLKNNVDGTETLSIFEYNGILSFKAYYEVILDKQGKLVIGAEEYKAPYRLVLNGQIINREEFFKGPRK